MGAGAGAGAGLTPAGSAEITISSGRVSDEHAVAERASAPTTAAKSAVILR